MSNLPASVNGEGSSFQPVKQPFSVSLRQALVESGRMRNAVLLADLNFERFATGQSCTIDRLISFSRPL